MVLDVREDIKSGGSPCSRIMDAASPLEEGDTLQLIAPFEPTPLYEVLGREGFVHESKDLGNGDWEVRFTKDSKATPSKSAATPAAKEHSGCGCSSGPSGDVVELDARGLEPPQPMVRILDELATLPEGATLHALTDRQPMHLFEQLEARGFQAESKENDEGGYLTVIRGR